MLQRRWQNPFPRSGGKVPGDGCPIHAFTTPGSRQSNWQEATAKL